MINYFFPSPSFIIRFVWKFTQTQKLFRVKIFSVIAVNCCHNCIKLICVFFYHNVVDRID